MIRLSGYIPLVFSLLIPLLPLECFADGGTYQEVTTARNAQQPFWLIEYPAARASLIMFAGGQGRLKIDPDGIGKKNNFLVRTRRQFADAGFNVAVMDKPKDKGELFGFRTTAEHATDVQAVILYLRNKYKHPVWLIGTSRGTLSAANAAARLAGTNGPDGIVLTASVLVTKKYESLTDIDLGRIRVPTLFVHNRDDGCHVCPYSELAHVMAKCDKASDKALQVHEGGRSERSNQCKALTPHGFLGLEDKVVKEIADWIKLRL